MAKVRSILSGTKVVQTYTGIDDLPIYNWFKIHETNDLNWLLLSREDSKYADDALLEPLWEKIFCEYIDTFGIPEKMREVLLLKRDIFVLTCDKYLNKDESLQTFINLKTLELENLLKSNAGENGNSVHQVKGYIERFMGFRINEREVSVRDFYNYAKMLKDSAAPNVKTPEKNGRE